MPTISPAASRERAATGGTAAAPARRTAGFLAAITVLCLLAGAGYGFVLKSLPYRTPQLPPPRVRLTGAEVASLASYPDGARGVPVLAWRDVSHRLGTLVTPPALFARELAVLCKNGFRSVRPAALAALAAGRPVRLPSRPVMLTFDDGLATDWTTVDPILRRYGFTAVVFVNPNDVAVKSPSYFLTRDELSAMASSGRWDIGVQIPDDRAPASPGAGHAPETLLSEWRERAEAGAVQAQRRLSAVTGSQVTAYAWPVAAVPTVSDRAAPAMLYPALRRVFAVVFGRPAPGQASFVVPGSAATALPRLEITAATSLPALAELLRSGAPSPPPADPGSLPWRPQGGSCAAASQQVLLTARGFGLCMVQADGSRWRNYELRLRLRFAKSADITMLIELRVTSFSRVEVAIGRSGVSVKQLTGRRWSVLTTVAAPRPIAPDGSTLSFLRTGSLAVTLRLAGRVLQVRVGDVAFTVRVSRYVGSGVIALGVVSPRVKRQVSFDWLRIIPAGCQAGAVTPC